jgi:hypothetical protein
LYSQPSRVLQLRRAAVGHVLTVEHHHVGTNRTHHICMHICIYMKD